jgi:hypothetical protein
MVAGSAKKFSSARLFTDRASPQKMSQRPNPHRKVADVSPPSIAPQQPNRTAAIAISEATLRYARRRG